jgi:hypothetical protein
MGEYLGAISSPSPRSYGERVGVRGSYRQGASGESPSPGSLWRAIALPSDPTSPRTNGERQRKKTQAAFGSAALVSANAQSIHCVSSATSEASTVAPHQIRRPAGASR